jgi:hypothetical protein
MEELGLGLVANHFDAVLVRTRDKSCIVVRLVVRTRTYRTILFATRLQSRVTESADLLAIQCFWIADGSIVDNQSC